MKIQVLVFMSEVKLDPTLKKSNFLFCFFMLLFTIIKLLPTFPYLHQEINFFPGHFAPVWSCSACSGA